MSVKINFGYLYKDMLDNVKDILNMESCSTTFYSTVILGVVIAVAIMLVKRLISKKQYKALAIVVVALPAVVFVLNFVYNLAKNKSSPKIVKDAESDMIAQKESEKIVDESSEMNQLVEETKAVEAAKSVEEKFSMF